MKKILPAILFICLAVYSCNQPQEQKNADEVKVDDSKTTQPVIKPAEGIIKVLWLEKQLDPEFNAEVQVIKLNQSYFDNINEAEKAIIGYYATFHGNECWWENDQPNDDRSNLRCKIIDALKLSYQCSDTHLDFLKKWFRTQPLLIQELDHCPTFPTTSTLQDSFEEIIVERNKDVFTIRFTICAENVRDNTTRCYEEIHTFRIFSDGVEEIKTGLI
jgi:hypothetical protein